MLIDLHNHTAMCCHAFGEMEEYVNAAVERGIKIFGFAAHSPWMPQDDEKMALSYQEVDFYITEVKRLQKKYADKIDILLGMEMDFLPDHTDEAIEFDHKYGFDYIIGSIHHINGWGFDQETQLHLYQKHSVREIYEGYYDLVKQLAGSGLFDVIGHLDLVKKFGYYPEDGWGDLQEEVAQTIAENDVVVELNTSGLDKPAKEFYPGTDFLKILKKYGVSMTLGSDAHAPDQVGRHFGPAVQLLKKIGYREVIAFKNRKRIPVSLG